MLQYNKLYQSLKFVNVHETQYGIEWSYFWKYLKLYNDNSLIYCSSPEMPSEINLWFNINNKEAYLYFGNYTLVDNEIEISLKIENKNVLFKGVISNETIVVQNMITKNWNSFEPFIP